MKAAADRHPDNDQRLEALKKRFQKAADENDAEQALSAAQEIYDNQLELNSYLRHFTAGIKESIAKTGDKALKSFVAVALASSTACFKHVMHLLVVHRIKREKLEKRIEALEAQTKTLQSKGIAYRGVWQPAETYDRGDLVTFKGQLFHANARTRTEPATSRDWQLAVQKGRDGKDMRA